MSGDKLTDMLSKGNIDFFEQFDHKYFMQIRGNELYKNLTPFDYHGMYVLAYEHLLKNDGNPFKIAELPNISNFPLSPRQLNRQANYEDLIKIEKVLATLALYIHLMYSGAFGNRDPMESWFEKYPRTSDS